MLAVAIAVAGGVSAQSPSQAPSPGGEAAPGALRTGSVTGLPVPRFVSLKANRVNVRRGPSRAQPVEWVYTMAGLPVEVTAEFENWRRIRDHEGDEGWVYHALLSGRRTALIAPWSQADFVALYRRPDNGAEIAAQAAPKVLGDVAACADGWCELIVDGTRGWVRQDQLWGIYPGETIKR